MRKLSRRDKSMKVNRLALMVLVGYVTIKVQYKNELIKSKRRR